MPSTNMLIFAITFLLSTGMTGLMKLYAEKANLLDVPNGRSSHEIVTPRGGGLSIVVVFLGAVLALTVFGELEQNTAIAVVVGGVLVAGIGFVDDHNHVQPQWRFVVQLVAATVAISMMGGLPAVQVGNMNFDLGFAGDVAAVIFAVWLINLYNFMDGIDGIAAVEGLCIVGGALFIPSVGQSGIIATLLTVFAASTLGFLVWNWPPAKIFMGDVGSSFAGFILAVFAIATSDLDVLPLWFWLITAGVFLVDSTVTLIVRVVLKENWYSAHRNHAYQKATRRMNGHLPVTIAVLIINLVWLFPLAWAATMRPEFGWWLTLMAWVPLVWLSLFLNAGRPDINTE